jgi:hypothetical protein
VSNDLTINFGEPEFNLVEPERIRRGEVNLHTRIALEKIANQLGFMGGEVIEDDVNLFAGAGTRRRLLGGSDEVAAGVAGAGLSVHAPGLSVQRGKRKRDVPIVLEAVTLGPSW